MDKKLKRRTGKQSLNFSSLERYVRLIDNVVRKLMREGKAPSSVGFFFSLGHSTIVVVASRGGDDQHPAWFLNLRDNPDVEVAFKGKPKEHMHARVATAEERARLWPEVTKTYKGYANYQTKTTREIPLVLLEPA